LLENNTQEDPSSELSGPVSPADIEYFEEVSGKLWTGDCAVFAFSTGIFIGIHTRLSISQLSKI
jgi:hypothetical protein